MPQTKISHHFYRNLVFIIGIVATLAYRSIVILNYYSPIWVSIAWYIGTIGFVWYFAHRYRVENKREQLIESQRLGYKIDKGLPLSPIDRKALSYILKGLRTSKARWNYIAIFLFSVIAFLYAAYNDIINWLS